MRRTIITEVEMNECQNSIDIQGTMKQTNLSIREQRFCFNCAINHWIINCQRLSIVACVKLIFLLWVDFKFYFFSKPMKITGNCMFTTSNKNSIFLFYFPNKPLEIFFRGISNRTLGSFLYDFEMKGNISIFSFKWIPFRIFFRRLLFKIVVWVSLRHTKNYCRQEKFCCRKRHKRDESIQLQVRNLLIFICTLTLNWKVFFPQTLKVLICRILISFDFLDFFPSHFRSLLTSLWKNSINQFPFILNKDEFPSI